MRLIYDVLFECKQQNIPGLLVSIDFQQAFDSLSWKFIDKTLDYFNFGPFFNKWKKILQNIFGILYATKWLHVRLVLFTRFQARGFNITVYFYFMCGSFKKNDKK